MSATPITMPQVSVIVCTRNRSTLLRSCLSSLAQQGAAAERFEVIVVDNDSSDETPGVVTPFLDVHGNFSCVVEKSLGLSFARNRGLREARGGHVAYIDDDAEAFPDWVAEMLAFLERRPSAAAFGGPYEQSTDREPPAWFPPEYGSFHLGEVETSLDAATRFLCGTNMVFRRDLLLEVGGFRTELGMSGKKLCYGEETRLQIDLKRQGHEIWYVPAMKVKHLLAGQKMKLTWLISSVYAIGRCSSATMSVQRSFLSHCAGICYGLIHFPRTVATAGKIPLRRKLYYAMIPLVSEVGALQEFLGSRSRAGAGGNREEG